MSSKIVLFRQPCAADANTHYFNGEQLRIQRPEAGDLAGYTVVEVDQERTAFLMLGGGGGWKRYEAPAVVVDPAEGEDCKGEGEGEGDPCAEPPEGEPAEEVLPADPAAPLDPSLPESEMVTAEGTSPGPVESVVVPADLLPGGKVTKRK